MSFEKLLIDSCTVQRFTAGAQDAYGVPAKTWAAHLTDEDCRIMAAPRGEESEIRIGAEVVIAEYELFIGDVDITEQDRVVLDTVTYEVLLVKTRQDGVANHHKHCYLRVVR